MLSIDEEIKTRFTNDKHRALTNIIYTAQWVKKQFDAFILDYGLTGPQFNILRILRGAGDWTSMNKIKDLMIEKSPNATRLCDKLVAKELVARKKSDTDGRVVFLKISDAGLALLAEIDNAKGAHTTIGDNLTEEETNIINSLLDKLRNQS